MLNFTNNKNYINSASGSFTTKYLNIFRNYGSDIEFKIYQPKGDFSSSQNPSQSNFSMASGVLKAFVDINGFSQSVGTILVTSKKIGDSHTEHYGIDNEVGTIFLRPTLYVPDTMTHYTLNVSHANMVLAHPSYQITPGGFIKTIMTVRIYDNEYHLPNIRPKFIHDQICFFTSELNLVSASYDPFSFLYDSTGRLIFGNSHPDVTAG